ncbi:MAG: hydrogenase expression/formation protein [Curvibacter sp.]|nr:hydrogenase expression/formation protein [Curvibacter sp.]
MKDFPIPVVGIGPGSQTEDDTLAYMPMPQGMDTFHHPSLPEADEVADCRAARELLARAVELLGPVGQGGPNQHLDLRLLPAADLRLINQVLGEGEVSARVLSQGDDQHETRVQESVFAGVWRVVHLVNGQAVEDSLELGPVPEVLRQAAGQDARPPLPVWDGPLPPNVQNAPALLAEVEDQIALWQPGQPSHVINLTLLPMSDEDIGFLDHHLGTGRVLILSRGYGNCRITNACRPHVWRVVYYNSQDVVILNTVEVGALPEVAQAAAEDLADSRERLHEVLQWVSGT